MRAAFQTADYAAVIEIKATKIITVAREENIAVWNPRTLQSDNVTKVIRERLLVADFVALNIFKGEHSPIQIDTPAKADSCGVGFTPGSQYLVYAYGPEGNGRISTNRCMGTAVAREASGQIEILGAIARTRSAVFQPIRSESRFNEALELIYFPAVGGEGEEPSQAMSIAEELSRSDPLSAFSQVLRAEMLSSWQLTNDGEPRELREEILALTDEALRINPRLAQAHVARARTYAKASMLAEAKQEIERALRIQAQLDSASFVQAEIFRRSNDSANAERWMRNYIAMTKKPVRKADGYQWLGEMWRDIAYHPEALNRQVHLLLARTAFRSAVDLDPNNAWRLVNFSAFLNEYAADFDAAEDYANKALAVREFPLARYHLAAARYQALLAKGPDSDATSLRESIAGITASTGISLGKAAQFGGFHDVIQARLSRLQIRAQSGAR